jgi:hypothetical protein
MEYNDLRAYFFGNMYLSSIQQGIQAAHVVARMFMKYPEDQTCQGIDYLQEWADKYETMILLNGGYGENLHDLYDFMNTHSNPFPFAKFHESHEALDNAITSVGIILPNYIWEASAKMRDESVYRPNVVIGMSKWEIEMAERLTQFGMAR